MQSRVTMPAELFLRPADGFGRLHGQHHVARVRRGVPHADLDLRRQVEPHLLQHRARLANDARAVLEVLVPVRRQPDDREGRARAQRAADDVLHASACSPAPRGAGGASASRGRARRRRRGRWRAGACGTRDRPRPWPRRARRSAEPIAPAARCFNSSTASRRLQAALVERLLDGIDAPLDRRGAAE